MSDVRDWARFIRGRWNWSSFGYEKGFPRNCQFTDIDAAVEFDGRRLVIEAKQFNHEDNGDPSYPPNGQIGLLRDEVKLGKAVLVVYGCGVCNDPQAMLRVGVDRDSDIWAHWWTLPKPERRRRLKQAIDWELGIPEQPDLFGGGR